MTDVVARHDETDPTEGEWIAVCALDDLVPDRGQAALVHGRQIAVFRVSGDAGVFAVGNRDPFSGANVMSRGIVGDRAGVPKVASPIFKQSFDLRTGRCFDDEAMALPTYPVRVTDDGRVEIRVAR